MLHPVLLVLASALALACPYSHSTAHSWQDPQRLVPASRPAASQPGQPVFGPQALQKLNWISGTWTFTNGGKTTEEHWRPLQGTTFLGSSHTFDAERTHFFEHLRITAQRGQIAYVAMPGGKPSVAFPLQELGDGFAVFENPRHDHPQRIRYQRTPTGITATISLLDGTRAQSFVFEKAP